MNQLNVNLPELPYAVSEAMNRLRINIKFCGKNTRKILLTSCQPNEGKSTISSYLWKMLAEAGFPTVLVDVDLRKSVMKTRFQMDYDDDTTMGLNHYLSGMAEYEDVIYSTNIPNGYMVPCTQLLENPSALLEDVRFKELLNTLSENYRFVIIDSPPLGSVSDATIHFNSMDWCNYPVLKALRNRKTKLAHKSRAVVILPNHTPRQGYFLPTHRYK